MWKQKLQNFESNPKDHFERDRFSFKCAPINIIVKVTPLLYHLQF